MEAVSAVITESIEVEFLEPVLQAAIIEHKLKKAARLLFVNDMQSFLCMCQKYTPCHLPENKYWETFRSSMNATGTQTGLYMPPAVLAPALKAGALNLCGESFLPARLIKFVPPAHPGILLFFAV